MASRAWMGYAVNQTKFERQFLNIGTFFMFLSKKKKKLRKTVSECRQGSSALIDSHLGKPTLDAFAVDLGLGGRSHF